MLVDLDKPIAEAVSEKQCLFSVREPKGSIPGAIGAMVAGALIIPVLVNAAELGIPLTIDNFLGLLFEESSRVIGYHASLSFSLYVIHFMASLIAGMIALKHVKALITPIASIAAVILVFLFLALFILGIPINYNDFFVGLTGSLLSFALLLVLPCIAGALAMHFYLSRKSCYIIGKGTVTKE